MKRSFFGALLLVAALLITGALPASAAPRWTEIKSDNFIIYSNAGEKRSMDLAEDLEFFRHYLQKVTNIQSTEAALPLTIYTFKSHGNFVRELKKPGIAGFYMDRPYGALAFAALDSSKSRFALTGRHVLFHEYVHYFMAQFSPFRYPAWAMEGFAEYFTSFNRKDMTFSFGLPALYRAPELVGSRWLSMSKLLSANRRNLPSETFYGQSWLTVHYLQSTPKGRQQLANYISELNFGVPLEKAYGLSFDIPVKELGKAVSDYWWAKKLPYSQITLSRIDFDPRIESHEIDKADSRLILARIHAHIAGSGAGYFEGADYFDFDEDDNDNWSGQKATRYLKKILKKDPENLAARSLLASVNLSLGKLDEAESLLNNLPPQYRSTAPMILLEGKIHFQRARDEKEKTWDQQEITRAITAFDAVLRLDPDLPEALYLFGLSSTISEDGDRWRALKALIKAREMLPQNNDIERAFAVAAMEAGYNQQAAEIFQDDLNWSSSKQLRKWARAKLEATGIEPDTLYNSGLQPEKTSQAAQ